MILEEGDKIFEILKCHIVHHEDGPNRGDVRACFLLFMRHHVLLKEAWGHLGQDWNNPGATTEELESSDVPFPLNLDNCIAMEVEEIRTRLEALHRGLRQ
jgi:hypothetical protein